MRDFTPELERRHDPRRRPHAPCELLVGDERHDATILDASRGGVFLVTEAPLRPDALVRVRLHGAERVAQVVHRRSVPFGLRKLMPGGVGLRWVRTAAADL